MKRRANLGIFGALILGLMSVGCSASVDSIDNGLVTNQTRFDFTVRADRDLFAEQDLEFTGSVGPYAVFSVTGESPSLIGPRVTHDRIRDGLVMLCGASNYFSPIAGADSTDLTFLGGPVGDEELTSASTQALTFESCSEADDNFQDRPDSEPMEAELFLVDGEQIILDWVHPPEIGSQVLIRIASLAEAERDHNDSHTIPPVCCDGAFCVLE